MTWRVLPEDHPAEAWDEALRSLPDHNIFQSSAWARHKASAGWSCLRLIAEKGGAPRAMVQVLARSYPGVTLAWCRGGPVGDPALWDRSMREALARALDRPLLYLRVCSYLKETEDRVSLMRSNGWQRSLWPLNRNTTMLLDLTSDEETLRSRLSRNWAHNLRRGEKRCRQVRAWENADAGELIPLYREMEAHKGIHRQYEEGDLRSMLSALKRDILIYRSDNTAGAPSALRACAIIGKNACDLLAASGQEARKNYATYALLWTLITQCKKRGVLTYDLGGVDPVRAKGVYDFKKGTGAEEQAFIGEWDWSRPFLLRPAACLAIRLKGTP